MLVKYLPPGMVKDLVDSFFVIQTTASQQNLLEDLIIPDGTHGILFVEQGQIMRTELNKEAPSACLNKTYIFGQKSGPVTYRFEPAPLLAYGAKLKPCALKSCFDLPAMELTDRLVAADMLLSTQQQLECEKIYGTASITQKILSLAGFLQQAARTTSRQKALGEAILHHIHLHQGQISIQEICCFFKLNYKYLERLFKQEVGLNPKMYCRIIRFNASILHYQKTSTPLTDLAYTAGYFDQMHFIKEVKRFTGLSPRQFFPTTIQPIASEQVQGIKNRLAD